MAAQQQLFEKWTGEHLAMLQRISRAFAEPADQQDLLQELLLAVWKAVPGYRGESQPRTYIYRVAHNRALTWRRRTFALRFRTRRAEADMVAVAVAIPVDDLDDQALLTRMYGAIRRLAPLDRSLVLLSLDGSSYADIGRLHGLSETNVGARLSRARVRIASLVKDIDDEI